MELCNADNSALAPAVGGLLLSLPRLTQLTFGSSPAHYAVDDSLRLPSKVTRVRGAVRHLTSMRRASRAVASLVQISCGFAGAPASHAARTLAQPRFLSIAACAQVSLTCDLAQHLSRGRSLTVLPFGLRHVRCESTRSVVTPHQSRDTGDAITSCVPPTAVTDDIAALAADSNLLVGGLQRFIDWIHVTYDLPWWLSIVVATAALRTVILPAVVVQMRNTAKLTVRVGLSRV